MRPNTARRLSRARGASAQAPPPPPRTPAQQTGLRRARPRARCTNRRRARLSHPMGQHASAWALPGRQPRQPRRQPRRPSVARPSHMIIHAHLTLSTPLHHAPLHSCVACEHTGRGHANGARPPPRTLTARRTLKAGVPPLAVGRAKTTRRPPHFLLPPVRAGEPIAPPAASISIANGSSPSGTSAPTRRGSHCCIFIPGERGMRRRGSVRRCAEAEARGGARGRRKGCEG